MQSKGKGKGDAEVVNKSPDDPCTFFGSAQGCMFGGKCNKWHEKLTTALGKCFNCGSEAHCSSECDRPARDTGKGNGQGDATAPRLTAKALELHDDTVSLASSASEAMFTKDAWRGSRQPQKDAAVRDCFAGVIS